MSTVRNILMNKLPEELVEFGVMPFIEPNYKIEFDKVMYELNGRVDYLFNAKLDAKKYDPAEVIVIAETVTRRNRETMKTVTQKNANQKNGYRITGGCHFS